MLVHTPKESLCSASLVKDEGVVLVGIASVVLLGIQGDLDEVYLDQNHLMVT